jgi:hypothetical protein
VARTVSSQQFRLVPGEKFMLPPIEANKALSILVLRTLGQSQDDVAQTVRCRKALVSSTQHWFREALVHAQDRS